MGDNYFTEMCSDSEAGLYLRLVDFVYHSILGSRVTKKKKRWAGLGFRTEAAAPKAFLTPLLAIRSLFLVQRFQLLLDLSLSWGSPPHP